MAAGAVNTARRLGFTFGVAVLGGVFSARVAGVPTGTSGTDGTDGTSGSSHAGHARHASGTAIAPAVSGGQARAVLTLVPAAQRGPLDHPIHAATVSGLDHALLVGGLLGLAAALVTVATMRRAVPPAASAPATRPATRPAVRRTPRPAPPHPRRPSPDSHGPGVGRRHGRPGMAHPPGRPLPRPTRAWLSLRRAEMARGTTEGAAARCTRRRSGSPTGGS